MKNKKYIQPGIPEFGYSFVLAGALHRNFGGYCIYVKYKAGQKHKITIKARTQDYLWLVCPDRELVIVRSNQYPEAFYPYGDSFDTCVDLNIFNDTVSKALNIEYIMSNYAHNRNSKNIRTSSSLPPEDRIQVLSDSGGLQLARGVKDIIHPIDLIEFYNNNVDAGMVLDLPLFFSDKEVAKKASLQQRKNIEIMLKYSKGVELINIFHGQTTEEREAFRAVVEDKRIPRVAIGGIANYMPISGTNAIYDTISTGLKYKQYHVLGIYTSTLVPIMVKLANSAKVHITSDSTSHIQSAVNKAYHFQFDIFHNMKRIAIGSRGATQNTMRFLPCQCKVCSTIKYMDVFGFGDNRHVSELLAMHNGIEMARYAASLQEICVESSPREYNSIIAKQLHKHAELAEVKGALDFIDTVTQHGLKNGKKKYKHHLHKKKLVQQVVPQPLFGTNETTVNSLKENILTQLKLMKIATKERC
jgi:hypothetical protein